MRRFPLVLLLLVFASLLATGCGQYGKRFEGDASASSSADGQEPKITTKKFDAAARKADGCGELQEFESEGRGHSTDLNEKLTFKTNPPSSGKHYQVASEWGVYDTQQPDVQTVHNLEHGHIVISYKGLSGKQVATLLDQVKINPFHLLVEPRKANPKKGVYYTAWTKQIHCDTPSAAALQYMIEQWRDQGPELFTNDTSNGTMGAS